MLASGMRPFALLLVGVALSGDDFAKHVDRT